MEQDPTHHIKHVAAKIVKFFEQLKVELKTRALNSARGNVLDYQVSQGVDGVAYAQDWHNIPVVLTSTIGVIGNHHTG